jgi:hypothetical protein
MNPRAIPGVSPVSPERNRRSHWAGRGPGETSHFRAKEIPLWALGGGGVEAGGGNIRTLLPTAPDRCLFFGVAVRSPAGRATRDGWICPAAAGWPSSRNATMRSAKLAGHGSRSRPQI